MKTILLTVFLSVAAIAFAACQNTPTTTTSNTRTNTAIVNSNTNSMSNINGMNHNAMMNHSNMESSSNAASAPYDLQFLDTMTHHHQGALDMARMAVEKTQNGELKAFAQKIITDQNKEIAQLKDWREKWFAGKQQAMNIEMPGMKDSNNMMGDGMKKMEATSGKEFDLLFLDMMTPHHDGAITMAKEALTKAEHPEIKTLANQIIKAQEEEIKKMRAWKTSWGK
jgi:uncharacterized protein (DUF305 family)